MARPEKKDVDYFPFYVKDGKTLFILEAKYECKGTGFFTNLMRFLCQTPEHYFCIADDADRMYFFSRTKCDEESGFDMLNLMAKTGKIDPDLWSENQVIVSPDLLESLQDAYRKRRNQMTTLEMIKSKYAGNVTTSEFIPPETQSEPNNRRGNDDKSENNGVNSADNPQRKEKKRKENIIGENVVSGAETPELKKAWNAFVEMRKKIKKPLTDNAIHLINLELEKIKNTHGHDPAEILNQSTRNSWQDVYPLKDKSPQPNTSPPSGGNGNGNGMARPAAYSDPFTICPRCHKEIQRAHLDGKGCIYCAQPTGDIAKIVKGLAKSMTMPTPSPAAPPATSEEDKPDDDIDFSEFAPGAAK